MKSIEDIVKGFNTSPILFVGSGISMRYLGLPNWEELLENFAKRINNDEFVYESYKNKAKRLIDNSNDLLPKVATLIENDFNEIWYSSKDFRNLDSHYLQFIKLDYSPFKTEIAQYIQNKSKFVDKYILEIELLKEISKKSLSGVITTNYDQLLEQILDGYQPYIGQQQLLFSTIQGLAEIYKIHGCITDPESIIINEKDYGIFKKHSAYLAAKLMTIFLEYPIIFMGYSISDPNIREILSSIVECLSTKDLARLQNRFVFIEYDERISKIEISPHTISFEEKIIGMTKIVLNDFSILYKALSLNKNKLPVKLLRLFKQEFYTYTLTNKPTANLRIAGIDDDRLEDEDLILAIGRASDFGLRGLKGLAAEEWYKDIVLNNIEFSADDILEIAFPVIIKHSNILPLNKYLSKSAKQHPELQIKAENFEQIISNSIKKNRYKKGITNRSIKGILSDFPPSKVMILIAHLEESEINVDDLERYLSDRLTSNPQIFEKLTSDEKTNLRRLIRIYDYLKYGKK